VFDIIDARCNRKDLSDALALRNRTGADMILATLQFPTRVYYWKSQCHSLEMNDLSWVLVCTEDVNSFSRNITNVECTEVASLYVGV
jgi:hypothetical protein